MEVGKLQSGRFWYFCPQRREKTNKSKKDMCAGWFSNEFPKIVR